ncbi:hypothetical protein [Bdellovibrio sp. HCB337]|uniref:hypothetical protein n=1 Tax=Bdellovibrio sp. HCB337 TaxID=3394358 RepID=UPI0039A695D0
MNKLSKIILLVLLMGASAFGTALLEVQGKVLRIEKGQAVIKSDKEEVRLNLKRLTKKNRTLVMNANGSDKIITIQISPETLKK